MWVTGSLLVRVYDEAPDFLNGPMDKDCHVLCGVFFQFQ